MAEFAELFARHVLYISPLNDAETAEFVARFAAEEGVTFSEESLGFIRLWAGGHPGLLEAICHLLGSLTGQPVRDATQDWIIQHRRAVELIPQDTSIQIECHNIWSDLTSQEQEALLSLFERGSDKNPAAMDSVVAERVVVSQTAERILFARIGRVRAATEHRAASGAPPASASTRRAVRCG